MENTVAYYCAPALAGIKPSNIVTCHKEKHGDISIHLQRLNSQLNSKDIYFENLYEYENIVIVMAYRKKALEANIFKKEIKNFLLSYGYPDNANLNQYISFLKSRMNNDDFPHEIGAFLGYPLCDILGFLHNKNEGCLLCGEWKVYHNAAGAAKLFRRFNNCRAEILKRLTDGSTLADVFGV